MRYIGCNRRPRQSSQRRIGCAHAKAHPLTQRALRDYLLRVPRQSHRQLTPRRVRHRQTRDDRRRHVQVAVIPDQQAVIRIERASQQWTRAGYVTDIDFEVLDLIQDGRVIQHALLVSIERTERRVERQALARTRGELPDHAVGKSLEMAAGAALPSLARKAVVQ